MSYDTYEVLKSAYRCTIVSGVIDAWLLSAV